ncbi:MAG: thioredoxin domain-containing protein [Candidatus Falkowbacteria bacterium]|nr:thioredoxin domain-containing protein [Candidatus Falkowbacteria bacterium]
MFNPTDSSNKNKIIIISALLVLLIALVVGAFWYLTKKQMFVNQQETAKSLQKDNTKILNEINTNAIKPVRPLNQSDHVLGNINAPVAIIFYGDFDCPFSADYYETLKKVKSEYGDKIAIGFRDFPHYDLALPAALAAECAAEQGKFWEMADKLFTDKKNEKLSIDQFESEAQEIGLNAEQFKQCWEDEKYKEKIQNDWQEGREANVIGTPDSFINGTQFPGAKPWDNYKDQNGKEQEGLKSIIDKLLQKSNFNKQKMVSLFYD